MRHPNEIVALSRLNFQSIDSLRSWLHCRGYQHIDFIIIWKLKIIISKHFQFDIKQNLTDTAWISYIIDEKDSKYREVVINSLIHPIHLWLYSRKKFIRWILSYWWLLQYSSNFFLIPGFPERFFLIWN